LILDHFLRVDSRIGRQKLEMTRNRTAIDLFSLLGTQLIVVVVLAAAAVLAVSRYFWMAGEQMRRVDVKVRRRALRRRLAA
jgi:hypothetical protein